MTTKSVKSSRTSKVGQSIAKAVVYFQSNSLLIAIICFICIPIAAFGLIKLAGMTAVKTAILYQFAFNGKVSGRMDGNVLMRNGRGRGMTVPALVNNAYTTLQRSLLSSFSIAWRSLTNTQQLSWNNFNYKKSDVFGQDYNVSGKAAYIALNQNLSNAGQANIMTAPAPTGATNLTISNLVADTTGGTLEFDSTAFVAGNTALVFATAPLSAGVFRPSKSAFRLLGKVPALVAGVADITALYTTKYGALPPIGTKVFVYVISINNTTGEASFSSAILSDEAV